MTDRRDDSGHWREYALLADAAADTVLILRVARAMYEAPYDDDGDHWPPNHPEDKAWWLSRAAAAVRAMR